LFDGAGDVAAHRLERPRGDGGDPFDPDDVEAQLGPDRAGESALGGAERGRGDLGRGRRRELLAALVGEGDVAGGKSGAARHVDEAGAAAHLLDEGLGGLLARQHDRLDGARLARAVGGAAVLVDPGDLGLGRGGGGGDLLGADQRIFDHPPLGQSEGGAALLVEAGELGVGRRDPLSHHRRRDRADDSAPPLEQQRGIFAGHAFGHPDPKRDGAEQLALDQRAGNVVAQARLGEVLARERAAERILVELAGEVAEGGDVDDLAVDHTLGDGQPARGRILADRLGDDGLGQDLVEGALGEERLHVERRLLQPRLGEGAVQEVAHLGRLDRIAVDARQPVAAGGASAHAAESAEAVGAEAGDDDGDQGDQEHEYHGPGTERLAEAGNHERGVLTDVGLRGS